MQFMSYSSLRSFRVKYLLSVIWCHSAICVLYKLTKRLQSGIVVTVPSDVILYTRHRKKTVSLRFVDLRFLGVFFETRLARLAIFL